MTRSWSACPTTASARRSSPSSSPATPSAFDEATLIEHVKERLASYKAPKHVLPIDTIGRAANGKVDYQRLRQFALDQLGLATGAKAGS